MPATVDSGADDIARDQARTLLESWTPFARVSRRLLSDLLDRSEIVRLVDTEDAVSAPSSTPKTEPRSHFEEDLEDLLFGFVVVNGSVDVSGGDGLPPKPAGVGMWHRSDFDDIRPKLTIPPKKLTIRPKKATRASSDDVRTPPQPGARLALIRASTVTPELAWSLQMRKLPTDKKGGLGTIGNLCRPELIWCDTDLTPRTHLEPLVHLLAGTIARDLHEPAAVVRLDSGTTHTSVLLHPVVVDGGNGLSLIQVPLLPKKNTRKRLEKKTLLDLPSPTSESAAPVNTPLAMATPPLTEFASHDKKRSHVFVFDPDYAGLRRGALDSNVTFDRIVHLTTDVPRRVPAHLRKLLDPGVFDADDPAPYYTSYIASVPVARDVRRRGGRQKSFKARAVRFSENIMRSQRYQYLDRLQRDSCVVPVDLDTVVAAWERWKGQASSTPFIEERRNGIARESVSRWGRAVTNRRIGLALSGGGACAYRVGPLLQSLDKAGVPIDVFAGLSGGALVGAFYCHSGLPGFDQVVALGPFIQVTEVIAPITTCLMEKVVDYKLGHARVEDLEIRFAAVAVALPPDEPPMTDVVVNGTLGEAVRVSGTLPPMFAPTVKNGMRFTDGGAGTIVPSEVACDFGADIVLACNAIPGPDRSNPVCWPWLRPLVRIFYVQRLFDSFAWYSYFWRQASQRFLRDADVAFEFAPEAISMLESNEFWWSRTIVERAAQVSPELDQIANQLRKAWEKLGDRPTLDGLLRRVQNQLKPTGKQGYSARHTSGDRATSPLASPNSAKGKAAKKKTKEKKTVKRRTREAKTARRSPKKRKPPKRRPGGGGRK